MLEVTILLLVFTRFIIVLFLIKHYICTAGVCVRREHCIGLVMILYRGIDGLCSNLSMRVCKIPQTNELRHFLVRLEIFMLGSVPTFKF